MKKIKVTVTRTDKYLFEVDDEKLDKLNILEYYREHHNGGADDYVDYCIDLSYQIMKFGSGNDIEGFGRVKTFYHTGVEMNQFEGFTPYEGMFSPGLRLTLITEDDDYDFQTEIIEEL